MGNFLVPNFSNFPPELRAMNRWVTWNYEPRKAGETPGKIPYAPDRPNSRASSIDPTTWGTFQQAEAAYSEGDRTGVGIVLDGSGLVGVDIDHCVTDGSPDPAALALLDSLQAAYVEISPSGTGLRAFGYADNLSAGCNGKLNGLRVELYSTGRYLTLTGCTIKTGPIGALVGFAELAKRIRGERMVNPDTGEITFATADERHAELLRRILSGDVYHDSLRDLAASLVATGMNAGTVVSHLSGLMDNSAGPHDERWAARRGQIPALVSSASAKYAPVMDFTELLAGPSVGAKSEPPPPLLKSVSVCDVITNPSPPPAFIWDGYLPRGVVSLLGAHGGTGKSTIALMLAVCAALCRLLFGIGTVQCNTLFVSLEDSAHVVRNRLAGICKTWGIDPASLDGKLHIVDGTEHPELFSADAPRSAGDTTATYSELCKLVQTTGAGLVVVDNASDAFGGDEIQRRQVRAFMRSLAQVARLTNCAVLLLSHVDKNTSRNRKAEGGEGYSGSTAWHNSARSRMFMTRTEDGTLTLEHQKSNFGKCRDPIALEWPDGGLPQVVGAGGADPGAAFGQRVQGQADDNRAIAILKMIAEFEGRGTYCSPANTARNHVFAVMKVEPAFKALKLNADDTKRIVNQCHRAKWLESLEYQNLGRKWCQRWTLTTDGRLVAGLPVVQSAPTAPTCTHIPGLDVGADGACGAAPTAPTCLGGTGERARAHEGAIEVSLSGADPQAEPTERDVGAEQPASDDPVDIAL